jgi:RNA polymerase sigma-70 factor, ECF subfamily
MDIDPEHDALPTSGLPGSDADAAHWVACIEQVAKAQDPQAFRDLFKRFAPMVKAYAYKVPSLLQVDQFAEELVQETMLRVWTRAGSFDAALASPGTWIFTIARNLRIDMLRRQGRHVVNRVSLSEDEDESEIDLEDIWFEDENSDVFNQLALQRNRQQIHQSLATLPPEQLQVLTKVYLEDKSHVEVSAELGLPLGTVKSRVRLALAKLKLMIDR